MRGTCVTMFQSLFESLLNHLFGEASLFNLRHLYLNYHLLAQKLFSLWKILPYLRPEIIRVLPKCNSLSLEKNKYVIYRLSVGQYGENL